MNQTVKYVAVFFAVALSLCVATVILVPHLRSRADGPAPVTQDVAASDDADGATPAGDDASASGSRPASIFRKPGKTLAERNKQKYDVGEMRREAEDFLRRFRGTPEERRDVIEECETGKALILAITDAAVEEIDNKSPEDLREAREAFEKDYRAQLDFLQTGRLRRMLKTPEEEEIIGSTFDAVQEFLETLDNALHAAGY